MNETEKWKDVPGYSGYQVSNLGHIKSFKRNSEGKLLSPTLHDSKDPTGYLCITLTDEQGCHRTWFVHRVVAMTFLSDWNPDLTVNHKDTNRQNNSVSNLEMMTSVENTEDFMTNTSYIDNKDRWKAKLSERATQRYADPEERKKTGEAISRAYSENECSRNRKSEASKRNWTNPETRNKIVSAMKERTLSEEQKQNLKQKSKDLWQDEEYRKKNLQSRLGKKFIYNKDLDVQKVVKIEDIPNYISEGWVVGKRPCHSH